MRTEFSRTRRLEDGTFETRVSDVALNYRDASGQWQPIDNELVRAGNGTFKNRANRVDVEVPASADGTVRFREGAHAVAFSLVGARGEVAAAPKGAAATFKDAIPGVDVSYRVVGATLKETLVLRDEDAPSVFRFDLDAGELRSIVAPSGDVRFEDEGGRAEMGFAAPWMRDAAGEVSRAASYELAGGQVVLRLDERWLAAPERRFPVVVDPTVYVGLDHICELRNGSRADTTYCDGAVTDVWLGRDANGIIHRGIADLEDLSEAVPTYAHVLEGTYAFHLNGQSPVEAADIDLHHLTRDFEPGATWNRLDGRALWDRAGGDYASEREARRSTDDATRSGWLAFDVTELAQQLAADRPIEDSVLFKAADESRQHVDSSDEAEITVRWAPRTGLVSRYAYHHLDLADGSTLDLNVANSNIVLVSNDIDLESDDGRFTVGRFFNSANLGECEGTFGSGSRGDFGSISIERNEQDGSYLFFGPGADDGVFHKRNDGTFASPEGYDATLTENVDGTVTIVLNDSTEIWTFDTSGRLVQTRQDYGYTIDGTYGPNGLTRLVDSLGNSATFGYDGYGDMRTITDDQSAVHRYDYDGSDRLTTYTSPTGAVTRYSYDGSGRLWKIRFPDSTALKIAYWGSSHSPMLLTPVNASGVDQSATFLDGAIDFTTVEPPSPQPRTVYFYDPFTLITDLIQTGSAAAISATGEIPSLDASYTRGDTTLSVDVSAAQYPDGIQFVELEVDDIEVDSAGWACDETTCPMRKRATLTHDPTRDAEGSYEYVVNTVDGDDERTDTATWRLMIDRTAPGLATNLDVTLDPDDGNAYVSWDRALDPTLPDGTVGSGADTYEYRYRVDGGSWSGLATSQDREFGIPGLRSGAVVDIQVSATDLVGNHGSVVTLSDRVGEATATADNPGDPTGESLEGIGFAPVASGGDPELTDTFVPESAPLTASAAYTENNCVGTPSPCGRYNGRAAAAYTRYWWSRRNKDFNSFESDCANFISQGLHAGGMRFMRTGGYNDPTPTSARWYRSYRTGTGSWWSARVDFPQGILRQETDSWRLATVSYNRIIDNDVGSVLFFERLRAGDLLYYRFRDSDGDFPPDDWTHVAMVTRVTRRGAWVAQHSVDYERAVGDIFAYLRRNNGSAGIDWRYRFVRPIRTSYDIG